MRSRSSSLLLSSLAAGIVACYCHGRGGGFLIHANVVVANEEPEEGLLRLDQEETHDEVQEKALSKSRHDLERSDALAARRGLAPAPPPFVLTFEGVEDSASVGNYYNGGGGPNYGIEFGSAIVALVDSDIPGGTGSISHEPSPDTVAYFNDFTDNYDRAVTYAAGFTELSFYIALYFDEFVSVYDGPNGTGNWLGSFFINATGRCDQDNITACGDPTGTFGIWRYFTVPFKGIARSFEFDLWLSAVFVDNVTITPAPCTAPTYWLWDPTTNAAVRELTNNSSTCIPDKYNIEIRPCTDPTVRPVPMTLRTVPKGKKGGGSGAVLQTRGEYRPPFLLWGDNYATGDVYANDKRLRKGTYVLRSKVDGKVERIQFTQTC